MKKRKNQEIKEKSFENLITRNIKRNQAGKNLTTNGKLWMCWERKKQNKRNNDERQKQVFFLFVLFFFIHEEKLNKKKYCLQGRGLRCGGTRMEVYIVCGGDGDGR